MRHGLFGRSGLCPGAAVFVATCFAVALFPALALAEPPAREAAAPAGLTTRSAPASTSTAPAARTSSGSQAPGAIASVGSAEVPEFASPPPLTAVPPGSRFQWDVPEIIQGINVPGVTMVNGIPVMMQAVVSRWSIEPLAGHLIQQFERAGLFIPPEHLQPKGSVYAQLSAIDPETMISYTVIFQPNKDGSTTLLLGVADVSKNPAQTADTFAPVFPGASEVVQTRVEAMHNMVYRVKAKREEVLAYYREVLGGMGYRELEAGQFQSADTRISVLTGEAEDGALNVTLNQSPGAP